MNIKEYIMVKNKHNHPKIEEINTYEWDGNLVYLDEICRMLNDIFHMNKLSTEMSYVVSFDHAKKPKGVCQIGHGDANEVITSMQNIFTFLMLTGANAFIVAHNHVSDMPNPSEEDSLITMRINMLAKMFDIEFIGHMIVHPNGYTIDDGIISGCSSLGNEEGDNTELQIEHLGNNMAATYVFGQRIEGSVEEIKKIVGFDE